MNGSTKCIYIILLNWNGWKDTIECVESCIKLTCPEFRIIIVDNGSSDGSESILRERFPEIDILQTGANLGFAGGNNVGIRHALECGAEYVWLLNNDTIVDHNALSELVKVADEDNEIGIVGSKIYYYAEPKKIWFAGGLWRSTKSYATHRGFNEQDNGQYDNICQVDYITGCSLLIKSEVIRQVGMIKEDYFLYCEEVDWNASVEKLGWKILYVPKSVIWHKISASIGDSSYLANRYIIRNSLLFFKRHSPNRLLLLTAYILYDSLKFYRKGQNDSARAYLHGLRDFVLKRFGKITFSDK